MPRCRKCKEQKPLIEFPWKNKAEGKKHTICKECKRKYQHERYKRDPERFSAVIKKNTARYKERARELVYTHLKSHPCVDCGEADPMVLEFDHIKGDERIDISVMIGSSYSVNRIKEEIAKCEIRCANCHRRKHAKERGYWVVRFIESERL